MKKINTLIVILIAAELIFLAIILFDFSPADAVRVNWEKGEAVKYDRLSSVPVLLYHNVVEDHVTPKSPFAIKRGTLVRHFKILRERGIEVISLAALAGGGGDYKNFSGGKAVVITFDDDYLSMYRILLPLVREFNYPVTLFVYTDGISRAGQGGLDWAMLREMEKNGIDIQGHSKSHSDLTAVRIEDGYSGGIKLYEELILSKNIIEQNLDKRVQYFAFPYGRYSLELLELARYAGYDKVFSTDYGPNIITRDNFCLRRHHIKNSYSEEFFISIVE